jgi:NAD(P)-dependent dehydrogenase (short-subunit alcohol dehydrogenase family)
LDRQPDPVDLLGIRVRGLELHQLARVELKRQGTHVVGVHVGFVDTDLTAALDGDKIAPAAVATAALDAVEADEPEAVVDDLSRHVKAGLSDDQHTLYPQIELDFAALAGAPT